MPRVTWICITWIGGMRFSVMLLFEYGVPVA